MNVPGVPDSVPWERVKAFLDEIGIDPFQVIARESDSHIGGIRIGQKSIEVDLFAVDENGLKFADKATGEIAFNRVHIPIVRAEPCKACYWQAEKHPCSEHAA